MSFFSVNNFTVEHYRQVNKLRLPAFIQSFDWIPVSNSTSQTEIFPCWNAITSEDQF